MAIPYDFTKLTHAQQEVLTFAGWQIGRDLPFAQPGKSTVKKLIERGLVVAPKRLATSSRPSSRSIMMISPGE